MLFLQFIIKLTTSLSSHQFYLRVLRTLKIKMTQITRLGLIEKLKSDGFTINRSKETRNKALEIMNENYGIYQINIALEDYFSISHGLF